MTGSYRAREEFGLRLRRLRETAGLNGKQLAERLGWPASKVSRIEHGKQTAAADDVTAWVHAIGAPTDVLDELLTSLRSLRFEYTAWSRRMSRGTAPRQHVSASLEAGTTLLRAFEPSMIPGLLQTADYARAILTNVVELRQIPNDVEQGVRLRIRRQEGLYDASKHFRFLLTEAALRYQPCSPQVLQAQLDRLLVLAQLDTVELAILPFTARLPIVPLNGFWIFDDNLVLVETLSAELNLRDAEDVAVYGKVFERLWERAVIDTGADGLVTKAVAASCG